MRTINRLLVIGAGLATGAVFLVSPAQAAETGGQVQPQCCGWPKPPKIDGPKVGGVLGEAGKAISDQGKALVNSGTKAAEQAPAKVEAVFDTAGGSVAQAGEQLGQVAEGVTTDPQAASFEKWKKDPVRETDQLINAGIAWVKEERPKNWEDVKDLAYKQLKEKLQNEAMKKLEQWDTRPYCDEIDEVAQEQERQKVQDGERPGCKKRAEEYDIDYTWKFGGSGDSKDDEASKGETQIG